MIQVVWSNRNKSPSCFVSRHSGHNAVRGFIRCKITNFSGGRPPLLQILSIAEYILRGEHHYFAKLVERIHVKILDFAKHTVVVFAPFHVFLLELDNIGKGQAR